MGTWVLILTMYNGGMTNITGFSSGSACADAGKVCMSRNGDGYAKVNAVCIKVK